jgi:hypothetical protein
VFWIVDNGAPHRGWTAAARLCDTFPKAVMIHTPVHAPRLNQIEIYFSVVQRKLLTPDNAANLDALTERHTAFEARYNQPLNPSTGHSTVPTSTGSSSASPPDPRRTNGRDH